MIIIDTNVLSEEMKPAAAETVHNWFLRQDAANLFTTSICEAEILSGVAILADGRRKEQLHDAATRIFGLFAGRTYPSTARQRRPMRRLLPTGAKWDGQSTISMRRSPPSPARAA